MCVLSGHYLAGAAARLGATVVEVNGTDAFAGAARRGECNLAVTDHDWRTEGVWEALLLPPLDPRPCGAVVARGDAALAARLSAAMVQLYTGPDAPILALEGEWLAEGFGASPAVAQLSAGITSLAGCGAFADAASPAVTQPGGGAAPAPASGAAAPKALAAAAAAAAAAATWAA